MNFSLLRHVILLFLMAPEQSWRTATMQEWLRVTTASPN